MSTAVISLIAVGLALWVCLGRAVVATWRHQAIQALSYAGLSMIVVHLGILVMAWSSVVDYYQAVNRSGAVDWSGAVEGAAQPDWPAWGGFATWQYDLSAYFGISLLVVAGLVGVVRRIRSIMEQREDRVRLEQVNQEPALNPSRI